MINFIVLVGLHFSLVMIDFSIGAQSQEESSVTKLNCGEHEMKEKCATKCNDNYFCMFGKCMCTHDKDDYYVNDGTELSNYDNYEDINSRPVLRHHIAHFCPDLEIARQCIRTCMKVGKPAFCGKDHVCYCGHRYEHSKADQKLDPKNIYAQFQDLYEKYFGTQKPGYDEEEPDY